MPAIGKSEHYHCRLEKPGRELFLSARNNTFEAPLKIYPVSNLINGVKTDDPRLIEPGQLDRDVFAKPWWGDSV